MDEDARMTEEDRPSRPPDPLRSLTSELQLMLDHLFPQARAAAPWEPACDIYETAEGFVVHVELAGVSREDVNVSVTGNVVTIEGRRSVVQLPSGSIIHRRERRVGRFQRSLVLPVVVDADRVDAAVQDGVLTLVLPRREARRIPIQEAPAGDDDRKEGTGSVTAESPPNDREAPGKDPE